MKVVFLKSHIQKKGGLEKYTNRLLEGFCREGDSVTLLTTDWKEPPSPPPYNVVSFGNKSSFSLWQLIKFDRACKSYIEKEKPDIVFGMERNFCLQTHYRAGNGCHAAYLERRKEREGFVKRVSFALNPLHRLILAMEKKTFESKDLKKLFVNSHLVEREILTYYPKVAPEKIVVVHNGVEWHELEQPFLESFKEIRQGSYQFLFIGNEYERKGLYELLDALEYLKGESWELTVIGKERNPKLFKQRARSLGLESRVHFLGPLPDVRPYYKKADCLVVPSRYDPFANVTVEALAMGLHVISSNQNGGHEVLAESFSNQDELISLLKKALHHPKTKESSMQIRESVRSLDFSNQINAIIKAAHLKA